jgi:hypothetical protein
MGMFDFMLMADNYEERKVKNTKINDVLIDTVFVNDSDKDFETAIKSKLYNENKWVIVELYDTKEEAIKGHEKWVSKFEKIGEYPNLLTDVSTAEIKKMLIGEENIIYERIDTHQNDK